MITKTLLDDVTVNTDDPSNRALVANDDGVEYGIMQVSISGTAATVELLGRVDSTMPWHVIASYTSSNAERVTLFPEMYAKASGVTAATVRAVILG